MNHPLPDRPRKGRGALGNPANRFERLSGQAVDDGWTPEDDLPPLRTTVTRDVTCSILNRNDSPDIPYDRSINPYRGCEHGCIYCFARPSHAYLGLSPGLDFETRLLAKPDAAKLLERELRRPGYRCRPVALGSNTDPYQPIERDHRITRSILVVLAAYRHPVTIVTKSALVTRDLDILASMAEARLASVAISLTTLDADLARRLEPRAATPHRRLKTMERIATAGVPLAVMTAPIIPALNDAEMERLLAAGRDAGATRAGYVMLRLPHELRELFENWLRTHRPERAEHVLRRLRDCRAGALNDSAFGTRIRGQGPYARLLADRFRLACKRLGLNDGQRRESGLDCTLFRPPPRPGDQLVLF